jgi:hypothetical protein
MTVWMKNQGAAPVSLTAHGQTVTAEPGETVRIYSPEGRDQAASMSSPAVDTKRT